jgi:hypothetical protein
MKIARLFLYSAGLILLLTAAAKIISSTGSAKVLTQRDPVSGIQFGSLFRISGTAEIVVAIVCIFNGQILLPTRLVTWLTTTFAIYRFGLIWIGYKKPCICLGTFTDALHISAQTADALMKGILVYLLAGSYATLIWLWRKKNSVPSGAETVHFKP